jgi:membrane protease YdiL (CAAX protease family)
VIGGCLAAGVVVVYAAGIALPRTRPLFLDERALSLSRARLAEEVLVQVPIGTVLLEEVAFRSVLPALLGRSLPAGMATGVSAGLFGLWHLLPALDMAKANPALSHLVATEELPAEELPAEELPGPYPAETGRLVAGTVVTTAAAGLFLHELRRRGGLLAPGLLHLATNSLGYLAARTARRIDRARRRRQIA